jgi:hypothetical protein
MGTLQTNKPTEPSRPLLSSLLSGSAEIDLQSRSTRANATVHLNLILVQCKFGEIYIFNMSLWIIRFTFIDMTSDLREWLLHSHMGSGLTNSLWEGSGVETNYLSEVTSGVDILFGSDFGRWLFVVFILLEWQKAVYLFFFVVSCGAMASDLVMDRKKKIILNAFVVSKNFTFDGKTKSHLVHLWSLTLPFMVSNFIFDRKAKLHWLH